MAHSLGRPAVASCAAAGGHRCRHAAAVKPLNAAGACRPLQLRPLLVVGAGVTTTSPWAVQRSWVAAADTASSGSSGAPEGQVSAAIMESMQVPPPSQRDMEPTRPHSACVLAVVGLLNLFQPTHQAYKLG